MRKDLQRCLSISCVGDHSYRDQSMRLRRLANHRRMYSNRPRCVCAYLVTHISRPCCTTVHHPNIADAIFDHSSCSVTASATRHPHLFLPPFHFPLKHCFPLFFRSNFGRRIRHSDSVAKSPLKVCPLPGTSAKVCQALAHELHRERALYARLRRYFALRFEFLVWMSLLICTSSSTFVGRRFESRCCGTDILFGRFSCVLAQRNRAG